MFGIMHQAILPKFAIGDWVKVNDKCLVLQYIGETYQVIDVQPCPEFSMQYEYTCKVDDKWEQIFWEHELDKVHSGTAILLPGSCKDDCDKPSITAENKTEDKEDKVIWV